MLTFVRFSKEDSMKLCVRTAVIATAAALVIAWSPAAEAAVIVFSGADPGANSTDPRPSSNAAALAFDVAASGLGPELLVDFEAITPQTLMAAPVAIAPGVTAFAAGPFAGSDIGTSPVGTPDSLFGYNTTAGGRTFIRMIGGTLTFSFATPVQAFGAYFSGLQLAGETITFSDGSTQIIPLPTLPGGVAFVGFTDAGQSVVAITANFQIGGTGDIVGVDDVRYVQNSAIPEPASMLLLGSGLAMAYRRRRRQ